MNILKDKHTWVIVAMFASAGLTAVVGFLPMEWNFAVSAILGGLAIYIKQNN